MRSGTSSHEGISFKKSLHASEQDRPDVARRRQRWKTHQDKFDPARLVFIDETWVKTNMTRTHGRCAKGKRLIAKVPHGHWRTIDATRLRVGQLLRHFTARECANYFKNSGYASA